METSSKVRVMRLLAAMAVVVAATIGGSGPASAETGAQRFRISFEGPFSEAVSTDWPVVASGVVDGRGVEKVISEGPGPSPGTFVVVADLVFPQGSITVQLNGTIEEDRAFGPNNCHTATTSTGTYDILGGTGALAGATGSGTGTNRGKLLINPLGDGCDFTTCRVVSHIELAGSINLPDGTSGVGAA